MIDPKNQINLTAAQLDESGKSKWAVFLPALSSFYGTYVGKQRADPNYVDPKRVPAGFESGIEGLNWLNPKEAYFPYHWALYSAGHADLDVTKEAPREDMVRTRDRKNSFILGDSGGFQIGKGVWEGDWKDANCPKAQKKRELVLSWMDAYMDRGMVLDIPSWIVTSPHSKAKTGINSFADAVKGTEINNDYFMKNRNGNCKFLNVLQGQAHQEADTWYSLMKHYCDPTKHEQPFEGWSMGGQNMCDIELILRRLVEMRHDRLLEKGLHDWMHFLGTSKLEWACILTDIQNAVRKHHNENFQVSFDCASPFLATANGQIYTTVEIEHDTKWSYRMGGSVDNKKYATDTRLFSDAILQDGLMERFDDSPISIRTKMNDICIYAPGHLNKLGKENKTSWDSFSYTIQMGHNVYQHIYAVQEANRQYDQGVMPSMLFRDGYDRDTTREVIDEIFATGDKGKALAIIAAHRGLWKQIIGTRRNSGKKAINAHTQFGNNFEGDTTVSKFVNPFKKEKVPGKVIWGGMFEVEGEEVDAVKDEATNHHIDDSGFDEASLDELEKEV